MPNRLKQLLLAGLHGAGGLALARLLNRHKFVGATVLCYHRVFPPEGGRDYHRATMGDPTATELEALILYLKRWFRFSTPQDCVARWDRGEELEPYTLILTFDDGYLEMYEQLLPVLVKCQVPATVHVTTDAIGRGYVMWFQRMYAAVARTRHDEIPPVGGVPAMPIRTPAQRVAALEAIAAEQKQHPAPVWEQMIDRMCDGLGWDGVAEGEQMMNWSQVEALHRSGWVTIGGHSVTHPDLTKCDEAQLRRELFESAQEIRERLRPEFVPFAYPQGRSPRPAALQQLVREAGFGCAFTNLRLANTSKTPRYSLGRMHVQPTLLAASLSLSGLRSPGYPTHPVEALEAASA
jgi:peptidoglycan/xylan/chitin deacetylase (PgdA/CDA1 family)